MVYFPRGNGEWLQMLEKLFFWFFFLAVLALHHGVWASPVVKGFSPWLSCYMACYILVPQSEIELASLDLEGRFLATGPSGKVLAL